MCPSNRALIFMESKGLVSIITPMYKGATFVGETIESVLRQTYTDWEMIIVDDCSPDNGAGIQVVKQYKDPRIKLIESKVNKGSSGARNIALHEAQGRYIALLDSDDMWPEDYLEKQIDFLNSHDAVIAYGGVQRIDEHTKEKISSPFPRPKRVDYNSLLKVCPICPSATVYDSSKCGKYFFNERLGSMRDDYVYWLDMLKKVPYAHYNPDVVILYRVRQGAVTANKKKIISSQWKVLREVEHVPYLKSVYCLFCWGMNGIVKFKLYK